MICKQVMELVVAMQKKFTEFKNMKLKAMLSEIFILTLSLGIWGKMVA